MRIATCSDGDRGTAEKTDVTRFDAAVWDGRMRKTLIMARSGPTIPSMFLPVPADAQRTMAKKRLVRASDAGSIGYERRLGICAIKPGADRKFIARSPATCMTWARHRR